MGILNRAQESLQVLKELLKPTLFILLWMSALRALLFVAVFQQKIGWHPDVLIAMLAGVRFDLLVLGFFWIPIVLITWLVCLWMRPSKIFFLWKLYLAIVVLFIFDLSWMDLLWSAARGVRLNQEFFEASRQAAMDAGWLALGRSRALVFTASMAVSSLGLLFSIYWMSLKSSVKSPLKPFWDSRLRPIEKSPSALATAALCLFSILVVASAARGTWTAHHLNLEHAQVSQDPTKGSLINQLPLNPVWSMDKSF